MPSPECASRGLGQTLRQAGWSQAWGKCLCLVGLESKVMVSPQQPSQGGSSSAWGLSAVITKQCPTAHHVSAHAGGTVVWKEHGNHFSTSPARLCFCGWFPWLCSARLAVRGCLCCQWLPGGCHVLAMLSPLSCHTHSWGWKLGSLVRSLICHA